MDYGLYGALFGGYILPTRIYLFLPVLILINSKTLGIKIKEHSFFSK